MMRTYAVLLALVAVVTSRGPASCFAAEGSWDKPPMIGMYVHQHWSYNHPYAARTWTLDDWKGYLDGLKKLGFNTVLIWPVLETMPDPLTKSDEQNLEKIAHVIDVAHKTLNMRVLIALCPNVIARNDEASKYTFVERPFFHTDQRVNPADAVAMGKMIAWRKKLFTPLKAVDGVFIIDSDPGGYPGSNNVEFVSLLNSHRTMFNELNPEIELYYWIHAGWESYCRFYATAQFAMGESPEIQDAIRLLAKVNPEPWGLASGRGPHVADELGMADRVLSYQYGSIEGEPSFPMTNFMTQQAYLAGKDKGAAAHSAIPRLTASNCPTRSCSHAAPTTCPRRRGKTTWRSPSDFSRAMARLWWRVGRPLTRWMPQPSKRHARRWPPCRGWT